MDHIKSYPLQWINPFQKRKTYTPTIPATQNIREGIIQNIRESIHLLYEAAL